MNDSILFWNGVSLEANRVSHTNGKMEQTGPTLSSRALAIVHLAMYDAYAGVINDPAVLPPYLPDLPPAPAGATLAAAVAGAAHAALGALFPSQQEFFDARLSEAGSVLDPGHDFGVCVARHILMDRSCDPGAGDAGYVPSYARYRHRVDPDNPKQGFHAPFYGARSKGFAITNRHALDSPATLTSAEYVAAVREVRSKGIAPELAGTLPAGISPRSSDEALAGVYWAYDGTAGLGTPPRLYNQIIRLVAVSRGNTEAQNARLFALVNVAMGDAGILAWDQKYIHDFWRPVLGVREHDDSMGVAAAAEDEITVVTDPFWLPFGSPATNSMNQAFAQPVSTAFPYNQAIVGLFKNFTPPFPAYPSGHATFGAAAFHITRLFYGIAPGDRSPDNLFADLAFVSDELNGVNQDNRHREAAASPQFQRRPLGHDPRERAEPHLAWRSLGVRRICRAGELRARSVGRGAGPRPQYRRRSSRAVYRGGHLGLEHAEVTCWPALDAEMLLRRSQTGLRPQAASAARMRSVRPAWFCRRKDEKEEERQREVTRAGVRRHRSVGALQVKCVNRHTLPFAASPLAVRPRPIMTA